MKGNITAIVAAVTLGTIAASTASSDEKNEKSNKDRNDSSSRTCVQLNRLRDTTIIDDHTILFQLRDGNILLNHLPFACPNLAREKRFTYRVTANRLCDIDTITVLQNFGLGLSPGATCQLGSFNPITKEAAEDLKAGPHKPLIKAVQVDPIKTGDGTADSDSGAKNGAKDESPESGAGPSSTDGEAGADPTSADSEALSSDKASDADKNERRRSRDK